jgi:predicted metal-dependent hydrolase
VRLPPGPPLVWRRPDLLGDGQAAFRQGRFHQARSLWEAEGLVARGAEKAWIQGLGEVAAGFLSCDENALWSAERQLWRGLHRLADAPDALHGVDVRSLRDVAELLLGTLRRGLPANPRHVAGAGGRLTA